MDDETVIKIERLDKTFKLPHEKNSSIKSALINFYKRNKSFEMQKALSDVSFEVKKGEFFGIVGRNGSGKSTLLKVLAGIYYPTKGNVHVEGRITPFIELGVGFSPELTGRENVFLNGALLGFSRKEMVAMYDDIVKFAELKRFMDQKLKNYSSGMQVRLAFSIAIRAQGDILLLDEVLAVGDAAFQQKCYDYFEKLKREKKTVVFVSHDMSAIKRFCSRAIYVDQGKITFEGDPMAIADEYVVANINNDDSETADDSLPVGEDGYELRAKIGSRSENNLKFILNYNSKGDKEIYVGISILKDGSSIGEISTIKKHQLEKKGTISYDLDTSIYNAGTYRLTAALFTLDNRKLVAAAPDRCEFVLRNSDETRGAALKLSDTWQQELPNTKNSK
ncbi:MAG TPA: ABC transporter ATP-binding protein [Candidatus Saccharimonadales bacterium]